LVRHRSQRQTEWRCCEFDTDVQADLVRHLAYKNPDIVSAAMLAAIHARQKHSFFIRLPRAQLPRTAFEVSLPIKRICRLGKQFDQSITQEGNPDQRDKQAERQSSDGPYSAKK
jgi:hypothetical protein